MVTVIFLIFQMLKKAEGEKKTFPKVETCLFRIK